MKDQKTIAIRLGLDVIADVKSVSELTGVKASDIYRIALTKAIKDIKASGQLPIPTIK